MHTLGQEINFDTARVYKEIVVNIQAFHSFHFIEKEKNNLDRGEVNTDNPFLLDSNSYFDIDLKALTNYLVDTNYKFIQFHVDRRFFLRNMKNWFGIFDPRDFPLLLNRGVVLYNSYTNRIEFISGDYFLSNTTDLLVKLKQHLPEQEAIKIYTWLRFYNYEPTGINIKDQEVFFFSTLFKTKYSVQIEALGKWRNRGQIDLTEIKDSSK